jgi:hypothetical protein
MNSNSIVLSLFSSRHPRPPSSGDASSGDPVPTGPSKFSGIRALIANYRSGGGTSIRASAADASAPLTESAAAAVADFPTRDEIAELADAQDDLRAAMDDDAFGGGSALQGAGSASAQEAGEEGGASIASVILSKKRDLIDTDSDDGSDGDDSASSASSSSSSTTSSSAEVLGARLASEKEIDEQWTHMAPRVRIFIYFESLLLFRVLV